MDPITSKDPNKNPRLDLLHAGASQQLAGAAGAYGPAAEPPAAQPAPAAPRPQPSLAPSAAKATVPGAEASRPATAPPPAPAPQPRPAPAPAPATPAQSIQQPTRRGPILLGVGLLILLIAAGGAWWWLKLRPQATPVATTPPPAATATPATPQNLSQAAGSGSLDAGKTTSQTTLTLTFDVPTTATSGSLTPEVELEPTGTSFTGTPNLNGQAVSASGGTAKLSVQATGLKAGSYHWQARDSVGSQHSSWVVFGGGQTAFIIAPAAASAPVVATIGGVAVTNPTTVTSNQPVITGTAAPNAAVTVGVAPDSQTFTTTADGSGNWSLTPNASIPNGQHTLSVTASDASGNASTPVQVALTINPATTAQTAPATGASGAPAAPKPAASNLAATGDNTTLVSSLSLAVMVLAGVGMLWLRRRYAVG